jgi:uncharacterized protein (DUF1810 family)
MLEDLERAFGRWQENGCPDLDTYGPDSEREATEIYLLHRTGLNRFKIAQQQDDCYKRAMGELEAGRKTGHWFWWIFPQMYGLGWSFRSQAYGIRSKSEARAYLLDPLLGPRYCRGVRLVDQLLVQGKTLEDIFGEIDALKYESSLRLFLPSVL